MMNEEISITLKEMNVKLKKLEVIENDILEMKEMRGEMNKLLCDMQKEVMVMRKDLSEQRKSVEFMSKCFDDLKQENESMAKRLSELEKRNDVVETKMKEEASDRIEVEEKVLELKNQQLQENLEFVGIPCQANENCGDLVFSIISKIDPTMTKDVVAEAYRTGNPKDQDGVIKKSRPILVKFKDRKTRNFIFHNKRKIRPSPSNNHPMPQQQPPTNNNHQQQHHNNNHPMPLPPRKKKNRKFS